MSKKTYMCVKRDLYTDTNVIQVFLSKSFLCSWKSFLRGYVYSQVAMSMSWLVFQIFFDMHIGLFWYIHRSLLMCYFSQEALSVSWLVYVGLFWRTYKSLLTFIQVSFDMRIELFDMCKKTRDVRFSSLRSCRSLSAKEPLIIELLWGKWPRIWHTYHTPKHMNFLKGISVWVLYPVAGNRRLEMSV